MTARCDLSDLPVDQCACRVHGPKETPAEDQTEHGVFAAKYDGYCRACPDPIRPGDRITAGRGGYVHEECA